MTDREGTRLLGTTKREDGLARVDEREDGIARVDEGGTRLLAAGIELQSVGRERRSP
jgi:hypothetical protein